MTMYKVQRSQDGLEHHGIKGQKWGVRNGPPYPLKEGSHSSGEKKAGFVVEVVTYAAVLAAYYGLVVYSAKKANERRTQQYKDEYYANRSIKTLADAPRIDPKSMSMSDHMVSINPDYPEVGATENCMFCTTAMAMRMKGYDVQAAKCPDGWSNKNLASTWDGYTVETPKKKNAAELESYLASQGDGAYGNLVVFWSLGGGHSMFYHVDNGEVKIYDTQANKQRKVDDLSGAVFMSECEVVRLDNCEPTEMVLGAVRKR